PKRIVPKCRNWGRSFFAGSPGTLLASSRATLSFVDVWVFIRRRLGLWRSAVSVVVAGACLK
ncbi:MAG: hypothetical protein ACLS3M_13205, partial [Collinsella sp.]